MNLFEISTDLQNIYNNIEENEGEITPEIEEALAITQENLTNKLNDYSNLISSLKTDIEACKVEEKRVATFRKSKEKLVEKLSSLVAEAVDKFGSTTKSGGKYYDLGTKKISVRNTERCEVNDDIIELFGQDLNNYLHDLNNNGLLGQISFTDEYLEHRNDGFDKQDLDNIKFNISFSGSVLDITNGNRNELLKLMKDIPNGVITYSANKSDCKATLSNGIGLKFAELIPNKSITIK